MHEFFTPKKKENPKTKEKRHKHTTKTTLLFF